MVTVVCFLILVGVLFTFSTGLIRIDHVLHPASLLGIITTLTGLQGLLLLGQKKALIREADIEPLMAEIYLYQRLNLINFAGKWADRAMQNRSIHSSGFPEWVSALVAAFRKDTYNCLKYLEAAKPHGFLHQNGLIPFDSIYSYHPSYQLWETITSCTNGQRELINRLIELLELEAIQQNPMQEQAQKYLSSKGRFNFWTIEKNTGDSYLSNIQHTGEGVYQWWDKQQLPSGLAPDSPVSIAEIINEIYKKTIPISIPTQ